jgi:hypothetical protein
MPAERRLTTVRKSVPWRTVWIVAVSLFQAGRSRLERNLSPEERRELTNLMTKSKGRRSNLTARQRQRFVELVKKAALG